MRTTFSMDSYTAKKVRAGREKIGARGADLTI
jgi:hypothetical protein